MITKLYETENKKNLSKRKIKEIEQNLIELKESLLKLNMYYDYDNDKCNGIRGERDKNLSLKEYLYMIIP